MKVTTTKGELIADLQAVDDNTNELFSAIAKTKKLALNRIRLSYNSIPVKSDTSLKSLEINDSSTLVFKDLGPQVSWKLVFILEYLGPILIHLIVYFTSSAVMNRSQTVGLLMILLHFTKREFETVLIHRFSNATMPLTNLPKNCFHYWVLGGVVIAIPIYSHQFTEVIPWEMKNLLVMLWGFAQASNFKTHLILRDLRPEGTSTRQVPRGYGFDQVTCPNYSFEILGWICFALVTESRMALIFGIVGASQMYFWAKKKHLRLKTEFGKDYTCRNVLVPYIL